MKCTSCSEAHHQGCADTDDQAPVRRGSSSCQCPCRPVEWRRDRS